MNDHSEDKSEISGNNLFIEWVDFKTQMLGSRKAIAQRIGKHENTLSRLLNKKQAVSQETIRSFRTAFNLSEQEYLLGPSNYHRKFQVVPLDPDRLTQVYPLRFITKNPYECSRSWSVWSHQHQPDYDSIIHVYVDLEGKGLDAGSEAVVHLKKVPRENQMVLLWKSTPSNEAYAYFTPWKPASSATDHLIGVVEYVISETN